MRDDKLSKTTQTLILVFPNIFEESEEDLVQVRCSRSVQTEAQFDVDQSWSTFTKLLEYTPINDITHDAQTIRDLPRKTLLKFSEIVTDLEQSREEGEEDEEIDEQEEERRFLLKELLNFPIKRILKQQIDPGDSTMNEAVQTTIQVRPHILQDHEVATVVTNADVQTSATFSPDASITKVTETLHNYSTHAGKIRTASKPEIQSQSDAEEKNDSIEEFTNADNTDTEPIDMDTTDEIARMESGAGKDLDDTIPESTKRELDDVDHSDLGQSQPKESDDTALTESNNMNQSVRSEIADDVKESNDNANITNSSKPRNVTKTPGNFGQCPCEPVKSTPKPVSCDIERGQEQKSASRTKKRKCFFEFIQSLTSETDRNLVDCNCQKIANLIENYGDSDSDDSDDTDCGSWCRDNEDSVAKKIPHKQKPQPKSKSISCKPGCRDVCGQDINDDRNICEEKMKGMYKLSKKDNNNINLKGICVDCCTEEELVDKLKELYDSISDIIAEEDSEEEEFPEKCNKDEMNDIEEKIISTMEATCEKLECRLKDMVGKYGVGQIKDIGIQNNEFARVHQGDCIAECSKGMRGGGRKYDECHCKLDAKGSLSRSGDASVFISNQVQTVTLGKHVYSSPVIVVREEALPADLTNEQSGNLPLNACGCTKRFCHCGMSDGKMCKRCDTGKMDLRNLKKSPVGQNIDLLINLESEYTDGYLELLEHEATGTQTELDDQEIAATSGADRTERCDCMSSIDMPWDLLLLSLPPKKRPGSAEDPTQTTTPSKAMLNKLAVQPMTDKQLLEITNEFLDDPLAADGADMGEIENRVKQEAEATPDPIKPSKVTDQVESDDDLSKAQDESEKRCQYRPRPRPHQVFDPDCERHNEPYMDRMFNFVPDDCNNHLSVCSSRIEMPWDLIELPKKVTIRRCNKKKIAKQQRICTAETRHKLKARLPAIASSIAGLIPKSHQSHHPGMEFSISISKSSNSKSFLPDQSEQIDVHATVSNIMSGTSNEPKRHPYKGSKSQPRVQLDQKLSGSKLEPKLPNLPRQNLQPPIVSSEEKQKRNERIANILESCKKEMEPIKDGINQLRNRIRELNLPEVFPPELPQRPGTADGGIMPNYMGSYASMMNPSEMYGPPITHPFAQMYNPYPMFLPYGPGMYPSPGMAMQQTPSQMYQQQMSRKCKCRQKVVHKKMPKSSSYNSSSAASSDDGHGNYDEVYSSSGTQFRSATTRHPTEQIECPCMDSPAEEEIIQQTSGSERPTNRKDPKPSKIPTRTKGANEQKQKEEEEISKPGEIQKYSGKAISKGESNGTEATSGTEMVWVQNSATQDPPLSSIDSQNTVTKCDYCCCKFK